MLAATFAVTTLMAVFWTAVAWFSPEHASGVAVQVAGVLGPFVTLWCAYATGHFAGWWS